MSTPLRSAAPILHPDPRACLPTSIKYFSSLITCNSTCCVLLATGPICSWGSRMHSNVDLHLFSSGVSNPWEACCAPLMLVLIYPVIWGSACCRGAESSISRLLSCLMLASVSWKGGGWEGGVREYWVSILSQHVWNEERLKGEQMDQRKLRTRILRWLLRSFSALCFYNQQTWLVWFKVDIDWWCHLCHALSLEYF